MRARRHSEWLSPESLHRYAIAHLGGILADAITPASARQVLEDRGQTLESAWPYGAQACLDDLAPFYRTTVSLQAFDAQAVMDRLKDGKPVVCVMNIGAEFYSGESMLTDRAMSVVEAVHAVVISGVKELRGTLSFRLRNSWGERWGIAGHRWAEESYLSQRATLIMNVGDAL